MIHAGIASRSIPRYTHSMQLSVLTRALLTGASFVVFIAGIRSAGTIIVPFLLACFIAIVTSPAMVWLRKRGVRPGISVMLIIFLVVLVLWMILHLAGSSITQFAQQTDLYQARLRGVSRGWAAWLREKGVNVTADTLNSFINPATTMRLVANTLTSFLRGLVTNTFMILVTVVFLLLELSGLPAKLRLALGHDHPSVPGFDRFAASLNRYLAIKSVISLATGLCAYILATSLRIDYAPLWGLLAFMLNYVPNIGSILAAVPPTMMCLVQYGGPRTLWCIAGYLAINVIFGNFIEPRVMGKGLGLSTLVVWMSLIFWGWVFGPVGMLLSVPLTMVVKIAMESNPDTSWIATLLGSDPGEPKETKPNP